MRCPECGSQHLKIEVHFHGFVKARFESPDRYELTEAVSLNSTWDEDSECQCVECDWSGTVAGATTMGEASASDE